jgi:hypothetical protein
MLKNGKGTIIFTGATAALRGSAKFAPLACPKFALRALSQCLAREFHPQVIPHVHFLWHFPSCLFCQRLSPPSSRRPTLHQWEGFIHIIGVLCNIIVRRGQFKTYQNTKSAPFIYTSSQHSYLDIHLVIAGPCLGYRLYNACLSAETRAGPKFENQVFPRSDLSATRMCCGSRTAGCM